MKEYNAKTMTGTNIVTVHAENVTQARQEIKRQLNKPGREALLNMWKAHGEIIFQPSPDTIEADTPHHRTDGRVPSLTYTDIHNEGTDHESAVLYTYVPMVSGNYKDQDRTPFIQTFINANGSRQYWVGDGYYNKKEYKSYRTASKALANAVGELVLAGWAPGKELTGHNKRFTAKMYKGYHGYYHN